MTQLYTETVSVQGMTVKETPIEYIQNIDNDTKMRAKRSMLSLHR